MEECSTLRNILLSYESCLGQAINFQKSGLFFSRNVSEESRANISNLLGVTQALNTGRYLGLPSLVGRNKKEIFQFIRDRLWARIQSWQGKKLSKAGKEIMIKAVAQSIPAYCMSCFLLPTSFEEELERMLNSFWWGNGGSNGGGIRWMKWDKLCTRKEVEGLGFRKFHLFNLAMLGKIGWRLTNPDALVCKVLKAKYFPLEDFLTANIGHSPSFTWRSIWSSQDIIRSGLRWRIGNGASVRVFQDPWLRRDGNRFVGGFHDSSLHDMRVKELWHSGSRSWDGDMVAALFDVSTAQEILSIPISPGKDDDKIIWHYSPNDS